MIPGIVASQSSGSSVLPVAGLTVFPLTYDETDYSGSVSLTRSGGLGPHITPGGFEGDGCSARYTTTTIPTGVNSGVFAIQASIRCPWKNSPVQTSTSKDLLVYTGTNDGTATDRLSFARGTDGAGLVRNPQGCIVLRGKTSLTPVQLRRIGRPGWKYEARVPSLVIGGEPVSPQAILFLDAATFIFSVHLDDTESRVYKFDMTTKTVVDEFTFGTSTHRHISSFARNSSGEVWCADYETAHLMEIDLDASFSSGTAVILSDVDASSLVGTGAIEFSTISGTEYLILSLYSTSNAVSTYFFPATVLSSSPLTSASKTKSFILGKRIQGIAVSGGVLYISRNQRYEDTVNTGVLQMLDLSSLFSLSDGATVNATTNASVILGEHIGPSSMVEDIAFNPSTGDIFVPTEGENAVADNGGYSSVWSSDLTIDGPVNHYTATYNGSNAVEVKINNMLFDTISWTLTQSADVISIGGPPAASTDFASGFVFGEVMNLAFADHALSDIEYDAITSGDYESNSLNVYTITMTNPGAETGDTTGWTVESGGMTVRNANPLPFQGSWYFAGGNFVSSVSRQRLDLIALGVPAPAIATTSWAKLRWAQASFSATDPGGSGIRLLDASDATISTNYAHLDWLPTALVWYKRSYPVALTSSSVKVDALYNASGRTGGTANDQYIDSYTMTVYAP